MRVIRSFGPAFKGLGRVLATQNNARVHAVATLGVVVGGFLFQVRPLEWCLLILAIGLVWSAEAANTAIENLADAVHPEPHPLVGWAKDAAAAAVLAAAIAAALVGLIILGPGLLQIFFFLFD